MISLDELNQRIQGEAQLLIRVRDEVKKVIVGQQDMIERILVALISGGHVLLEGVPGLAKTLTIKTIAQVIGGLFRRIQFTPDLLPADIIGTMIYNPRDLTFFTKKGPLFANIILADEINRAPAKVQSALLEAMQEHQVTIGDDTFKLPSPFFVLATQNPIEQEGTYPLPEAQIDRFMLKLNITYPTDKEEKQILDQVEHRSEPSHEVRAVLSLEDIARLSQLTRDIYIDEKLKQYIVDIVAATRTPEHYGLGKIKSFIGFGASPRASIYLMQSAKAYAFLSQRGYVIPDDIKFLAKDVLRHRIILSYEAQAEQILVESIIEDVLKQIDVP